MTTSTEDFFGPEYWVMKYHDRNSLARTECGFKTLNAALKRLQQLQISVFPATIEGVQLEQIFDNEIIPLETKLELEYMEQRFDTIIGDPHS